MLTEEAPRERVVDNKKYGIDDFPHLKEMRDYMVKGPTEFCIERAKLKTQFLKEKGGLDYADPFTRQVETLEHIIKNKKPNIFSHELLAGSSTSKRKGVLFYPEFFGSSIWPELLSMPLREENPYEISMEDVFLLDGEILPFWMDKNVLEQVRRKIGDNELRLWDNIFTYMNSKLYCQSHTIPSYKNVLDKGLIGLIKEAKRKMKPPKDKDKEKQKEKEKDKDKEKKIEKELKEKKELKDESEIKKDKEKEIDKDKHKDKEKDKDKLKDKEKDKDKHKDKEKDKDKHKDKDKKKKKKGKKGKKKGSFYKGLIRVMESVIEYADNLSEEASRQAVQCQDLERKAQLEKMSEICKKVPANPPKTFWEAVQSIWTCMNALYQEQNNVGFSIGRVDQLLNAYYLSDLENGTITRREAIEILAHFWYKIGDPMPLVPEMGDYLSGGTASNQAITIGGCDQNGLNAVNETTFLCLDVTNLMEVRDPNVNARVREDDPPEYTQRLAEVIISTGATPSLINDQIVIQALEKTGVSLEDARDFAQVGCLEPNSTGRTFGHTGAILLNLMSVLEIVFNNGDSLRSENIGLKLGDLSTFTSFDMFKDATKKQIEFIIQKATRINNVMGEVWKYLHQQPLLTALFEGPYESGKSLLEGGAKYNSSGIAFIGLADLIDSLYAIKKVVFDEKKCTFQELDDILKADFQGHKELYSYVRNKLDHFGNDSKEVDDIGVELVDYIYDVCLNIEHYRNGRYLPGYWSMTMHSAFGIIAGANPHGRNFEEPFASGLTPVSFAQKNGPSAVFNSLSRLDCTKMPNGMALNMKFNKSMFDSQEKLEKFKALFKAYFAQGGMQVQYTIQDGQTLIDAKNDPGKFPNLMVRISGYTVYFNDLNEFMKDEIITRAIMKL